ncbi:MAG: glycosyltransferase N-terminal domain-containing protein [Phycisphaerales bacterium]
MNGLDLAYILAAGVTAPVWARKRRAGWGERLGRIEGMLGSRTNGERPRLLLHAVSVGEVSALRPLVPRLTPEAEVIVSTTTDTGLERARTLFADSCAVVRYPLDFSWSVRRFLDAVRPDAVGLVELELWPNFLRACRARTIPVCVINGRLSERSFKGYRRFARSAGWMFRSLEFAAVQDESYASRFEAMGVAPERCLLTGSMKWDSVDVSGEARAPSAEAVKLGEALGIDRDRPLIVAGSTGPGEEALMHDACPAGVQLACAPRKPERFEEAAEALPGCVRRSGGASSPRTTDRFLLDTIGELGLLYQLADLVVIGRSFFDLYGSDPTEPVALAKPTLIGPRFGDFDAIVTALDQGGGIVVCPRERLAGELAALMGDPLRRAELAARGRACVREHQGASSRHAELLLSLVTARR